MQWLPGRHQLTVDLTTRGRIWLEAHGIPLPDPWSNEDVIVGIDTHYPGGRDVFLAEAAPAANWVIRRRWEDRFQEMRPGEPL